MSRAVLTTDHVHDHGGDDRRSWATPTEDEEAREGAVVGLVTQLYDTVLDDCQPCRQQLMDVLKDDPATTGILVHWACLVTAETYGELPEVLMEGSEPADAPFHPTAAFRKVAQAYAANWGTSNGATGAVCEACAGCTSEERLAAATTALELLVGFTEFDVDFLYQ